MTMRGVPVVVKFEHLAVDGWSGEYSSRAVNILRRLADGQDRKRIAREMGITSSIIRNDLSRLAERWGLVNSAPHLVAVAMRKGLVK